MELSLTKNQFETNKVKIVDGVKDILLQHTNSADEMLLEYITIMISNSKSVREVRDDLEALVGENVCDNIANRYGSIFSMLL
jgi:hypothetical protein